MVSTSILLYEFRLFHHPLPGFNTIRTSGFNNNDNPCFVKKYHLAKYEIEKKPHSNPQVAWCITTTFSKNEVD